MASSSDNNEDSDFIPSDGENEISDSEEDSLVSDTKCEALELSGRWQRVTDFFADSRPNAVPELLRNFSGVNPDVAFTSDMTKSECFQQFITDDVVSYLCRCVNDRADKFFADNPDKRGFVNKLKWKEVGNGEMHVFLAL